MPSPITLTLSRVLAVLLLTAAADAAEPPRTVVRTGIATPVGDRFIELTSFDRPQLNDAGQVSFRAFGRVGSRVISGVLRTENQGLELVVQNNEPARGVFPSGNFTNVGTRAMAFGEDGGVAFHAFVEGSQLESFLTGVWVAPPGGSSTPILLAGMPAPGFSESRIRVVEDFTASGGRGSLAQGSFVLDLEMEQQGGFNLLNNSALFVGGPDGELTLAVQEGEAPDPSMVEVVFADGFSDLAISDSGEITFSSLVRESIGGSRDRGIWSWDASGYQTLAQIGARAPGVEEGVAFGFFSDIQTNRRGRTAVLASLVGDGILFGENREGIWIENSEGQLELRVREGDSGPSDASPATLGRVGGVAWTDSGYFAFLSSLEGPAADEPVEQVILQGADEEPITTIAVTGAPAPGVDDAVFRLFDPPVANAAGQVAFVGRLSGEDVTTSHDEGVWALDRDGRLLMLLREGDTVDVSDDPLVIDERTVAGFAPASSLLPPDLSINELGQVLMHVRFTDNTTALLLSDSVAVPEPTALLPALIAGIWPTRSITRRRA